MTINRRDFLLEMTAALAGSLLISDKVLADGAILEESDPAAQALGYKKDATKVDKTKYSNYADGESCANCSFYQGAQGSMSGNCPLFPGKLVNGPGWCKNYTKKG
jgi:High potential iron-sulfur protein